MNELPLNGNAFQQFTLLQPGVNFAARGNDVVGGRGFASIGREI